MAPQPGTRKRVLREYVGEEIRDSSLVSLMPPSNADAEPGVNCEVRENAPVVLHETIRIVNAHIAIRDAVSQEAEGNRAIEKVCEVVEIYFSTRKRMEEKINVVANEITAETDEMLSVCPREHVRTLKIFGGGTLITQRSGTDTEQAVHFDRGHARILWQPEDCQYRTARS